MRLWAALYAMVWVVFLEFLLAMKPSPGPLFLDLHFALGLVIVALAYSNMRALRETVVPGRLKRITIATFDIALAMVVLGLLVWFNVGAGWSLAFGVTVWQFFLFLHVVNALAVITQSAAVALAYDMWEEKEFAQQTRPGEVPPNPSRAAVERRAPP
jgi:hypothetical protein